MARKKPRKKTTKKPADQEMQGPIAPLLEDSTQRGLIVIALFALAAMSFLSLIGAAGTLGVWVSTLLGWLFGWGRYIVPILFVGFGYAFLHPDKYEVRKMNYVGLALFIFCGTALLHLFIPLKDFSHAAGLGRGGGYIGIILSYPLIKFTGIWVTVILLLGGLVGSWLLLFRLTITRALEQLRWLPTVIQPVQQLMQRIKERRATSSQEEDPEEEYEEQDEYDDTPAPSFSKKEVDTSDVVEQQTDEPEQLAFVPKQKKRRRKAVDLPVSLLSSTSEKALSGNIEENKRKIQKTLENFNLEVEMGEVNVGPMVTQYTLRPAEGVKLTQITTLQNDIALALAAHPIRIEAPIPGQSLVGIEIPNETAATVTLKELLTAKAFKERKDNLALCLGKDVSGEPAYKSVAKMPHMLIAGATGSGKSVCINGIITSLLYQNTPEELRFIMVDPKRVELTVYNGIPHLLTPVITEVEKTINALKWTVAEMDRRYETLARAGKRNLESFNMAVEESHHLHHRRTC